MQNVENSKRTRRRYEERQGLQSQPIHKHLESHDTTLHDMSFSWLLSKATYNYNKCIQPANNQHSNLEDVVSCWIFGRNLFMATVD